MSNELWHNYTAGNTLYAIRFQRDGDVFITSGASDETWGTGGNDADDYDVTMTETTVGSSGHYVGDFDASGNIAAGTYRVCVYVQAGANPADGDAQVAQGEISWDAGGEEIGLGDISEDFHDCVDIEVVVEDRLSMDESVDVAPCPGHQNLLLSAGGAI